MKNSNIDKISIEQSSIDDILNNSRFKSLPQNLKDLVRVAYKTGFEDGLRQGIDKTNNLYKMIIDNFRKEH